MGARGGMGAKETDRMNTAILKLERARESLVRIGLPAGKRLFEAAIPFLDAFSEPKRWPEPLRIQAAMLAQLLTERGEIYETVHSLMDEEAQTLVNDLRRFIDECLVKLDPRGVSKPTYLHVAQRAA